MEKDLDTILMIKIHKLHNSLPRSRDSQGRILKILSEHDGISQKKLQEIVDIKPGSLSEVLLKLERMGYIRKSLDKDDKRKQNVYITDEGRAAFEKIFEEHVNASHEFFKDLSEAEKNNLLEILKKLLPSAYHDNANAQAEGSSAS